MNQKKYSELSDTERNDLFNKYKKQRKKGLNIRLIIYSLLLAVVTTLVLTYYNTWKKDYKVDDLVMDYVGYLITLCIVIVIIIFVIIIVVNILKRRNINKVYTVTFQKYLFKNNIILDKVDNQENKGI